MHLNTFLTAEELMLDERFLAWARGDSDHPGYLWVETLRQQSDEQELEVWEALLLFRSLVKPEFDLTDQQAQQQTGLLARLERETGPQPPERRSPRPSRVLLAALVVVFLFLGGYYFIRSSDAPSQSLVGAGQETILEDGTLVQLTARSTLTFQQGADPKQAREVWVKGVATFQVKKTRTLEPFLVHTPAFVIEVTGTRFVVNNTSNEVSVLLQEGSVNLRFPDGEIVQMKPGDYFSMADSAIHSSVVSIPAAKRLERSIVFEDAPLEEVIREIESRYPVQVRVLTPELQNKRITGILPNNNLSILLQALEAAMECTIIQNQQTLFIKTSS